MKILLLLLFVSFYLTSCSTGQKNSDFWQARSPASHDKHDVPLKSDEEISAACDRVGWSETVSASQQAVIDGLMANPEHRLQHALWHTVRSGLKRDDLNLITQTFGKNWDQSHSLCPAPSSNAEDANTYNPAGEDFLYMHHQMVLMLREALVAANQKCILGWQSIPDPKAWPLPAGSAIAGAKTDAAFKQLKSWDSFFQNPEWLNSITLSQMGWALEFTIHNNLHMRYATDRPPKKFQAASARDDGAVIPFGGSMQSLARFNDPSYNWLADPYGAAVNPIFWKIHGYVDFLLMTWVKNKKVNGTTPYTRIDNNCAGDPTCYQWKGLWTGDLPPSQLFDGLTAGTLRSTAQSERPSAAEIRIHRARLAHQRLGVISSLAAAGGTKSDRGISTPFDDARANIGCQP